MTQPIYTFEEFSQDLDELQASGVLRGGDWEANVIKVYEYMKTQYSDEDKQRFVSQRFVLIMGYISEHISEFDTSDYAVYGSEAVGALGSEHLFRAVHELFTTRTLTELKSNPGIEEVMQLADKYRAATD